MFYCLEITKTIPGMLVNVCARVLHYMLCDAILCIPTHDVRAGIHNMASFSDVKKAAVFPVQLSICVAL